MDPIDRDNVAPDAESLAARNRTVYAPAPEPADPVAFVAPETYDEDEDEPQPLLSRFASFLPSKKEKASQEADSFTISEPKRAKTIEEKQSWRPKWLQYEKSVKKGEVADSIRSLGTMLMTAKGESGPLSTLAEQYKGTELGSAYGRIYQSVMSGNKRMAEAFRDEEEMFPKIVADLLIVGSRSGSEGINLQKAADIMDEGQDLIQKIKSAVMQPAILLGVIIVFLYAVVLFVIPQFSTMFASMGKELPPMSQIILGFGDFLKWLGIAGVLSIGGWILYYKVWGKNNKKLRIWLGRTQFKLPVLGKVLQSQRLTQTFSILAGLIEVGMNERTALLTAAEASGNAAIKDHLFTHIKRMDAGQAQFADLAEGFLFPLSSGYMMKNGFDSGSEVQALTNLARVYGRDANKRAEALTRSLEPIANGAVSIIFVFVMVATYLPVYDMMTSMTDIS